MSEDFYARLLQNLETYKRWKISLDEKQSSRDRPPLPQPIRPLLYECTFNQYNFTEEQASTLIGFSGDLLKSYKLFLDFVLILAYCGTKGYPNMRTSLDVDPYLLRKTNSHPSEIAARCLEAAGVYKKGEVPVFYDYGTLSLNNFDTHRGVLLLLTNYRAIVVGGFFQRDTVFHQLVYENPDPYLESLDYIYLDKRLRNIVKKDIQINAQSYTKFFKMHKDKHTIYVPLFLPSFKIKSLKISEEGFQEDWLPIFFSPVDLGKDIDDLKKKFDETRKRFPHADFSASYPYTKKSIDKEDQKRRTLALSNVIEEIHEPIKDTTVAWHVND